MRLILFHSLLAFLAISTIASGQSVKFVDLEKDRVPMADLSGPWRFHTGDDQKWSEPDFDDGAWPLIRTDQGWADQGYKGYSGFAWYRIFIKIPAPHSPLALYLPNVDDVCEIFVNGKLIDAIGRMPPRLQVINDPYHTVSIADYEVVPGRPLLLAIRVWLRPGAGAVAGGGLHPAPLIGEAVAIAEWRQLQEHQAFWESATAVIDLYSNILVAFASLVFFALRRGEREYLWYGLNQIAWAGFQAALLHITFLRSLYLPWLGLLGFALLLGYFTRLEFVISLIGQCPKWLYWVAILCTCGVGAGELSYAFRPGDPLVLFNLSSMSLYLTFLMVILIIGTRNGNPDAPLVLIPIGLQFFTSGIALLATEFKGSTPLQTLYGFFGSMTQWPFPISADTLAGDFETFAILIILIRRFARSRRDEGRLKSEMEAARVVQQVLLPAEIPTIPGFQINSVYRPAGEVGGDFFQILPIASGAALIVIGDVSGKGMPAAMTVSLLVGTVRTLAHYTHCPGEILWAMNQRMLGRSAGGFTTCLVLRADPDGTLTVSNAGHLAPYRNQAELNLENGLPLGLDANTVYAESAFELAEGEQLTLLTDGVVEARNKIGELFGFERTNAISIESADSIAHAAQEFGQEDDITVLTIMRLAQEDSVTQQIAPALLPSPA